MDSAGGSTSSGSGDRRGSGGPPGRRRRRLNLSVFIQALEGSKVVVELRNDSVVRGMLLHADDQLNLQLGDASYTALQGTARVLPYVYLRSRSVRFVHLPGNLDPAAAIEARRKRVAAAFAEHALARGRAGGSGNAPQKGQQLELGGEYHQQDMTDEED